jgi:hypothetical protein
LLNRGRAAWQPPGPKSRFEQAIALWQTYNRRLLEIHRARQFPVISFDEKPAVFEAKLQSLAELLSLDPEPTGEPFFIKERPRSEMSEGPLPPETEELYRELAAQTI